VKYTVSNKKLTAIEFLEIQISQYKYTPTVVFTSHITVYLFRFAHKNVNYNDITQHSQRGSSFLFRVVGVCPQSNDAMG